MTWAIWQIFTRAYESLKIVTLMASFCLKLNMHELKNYRSVMCHDNEEWCKNWRRIDLSVQNWHEEFDKFWPEHSKISKICTLMDCFWPKYIMFELKKYRGVMFDGTEYWWKIEAKLNCAFKNNMRNLANVCQSTFKGLKIGTLWDLFIESRKYMSLTLTSELCVMTMTNNAKIEKELTCQFKIDLRNLMNFDPST